MNATPARPLIRPRRIELRATGQVVKFDGFLTLYQEGKDDEEDEDGKRLPPMKAGDPLKRERIASTQHFTEPPPRYSEASLVKRMEELGIGRPSTYAAVLQTLRDREYVRIDKSSAQGWAGWRRPASAPRAATRSPSTTRTTGSAARRRCCTRADSASTWARPS